MSPHLMSPHLISSHLISSHLFAYNRYLGTVDCFSKIVQEGGVAALYRGLPVALFGVVLFKALFMGGYDTSKVV